MRFEGHSKIEVSVLQIYLTLTKQELEVSKKLEHPHVIKLLDLCENEDDIYIELELIDHSNFIESCPNCEEK